MLRYWIFWFVFNVLGRLPLAAIYWIADVMAWASYRFAKGPRANVIENLRHVMPPETPEAEIERTAKQVFRNVTQYYADMAYMPRLDPQKFFDERLKVYGIEELLRPALGAHGGDDREPVFAQERPSLFRRHGWSSSAGERVVYAAPWRR